MVMHNVKTTTLGSLHIVVTGRNARKWLIGWMTTDGSGKPLIGIAWIAALNHQIASRLPAVEQRSGYRNACGKVLSFRDKNLFFGVTSGPPTE